MLQHFIFRTVAAITLLGLLTLHAASRPAAGQAPPASQPAAKRAVAAGQKLIEPATPEQAAKVLDLRTFPRLPGAKLGGIYSLSTLMYQAKATSQAAFDFQRKELAKLGFKELPGGYSDVNNNSGHFTKDGFIVSVSALSEIDPKKAGMSSVTLVNSGNVDLGKLPVPKGAEPFYPNPREASYTVSGKVADIAAACRKLLLADGWEPYGQAGADRNQPDSSMQYYKQNGVRVQSWIQTTMAVRGKTLIRYSTELLSADLPAPPDATDPRYVDSHKTLHMDEPTAKTDAILAFYTERLPKMGWKATTERPIVDADKQTQFLVFRNAQKDLLTLDLTQLTNIVRVELTHQTLAEVEEEERLAKAEAEKRRAEEEKRNRKIKVAVPLPAKAKNVEHDEPNLVEFGLVTGSGPATLTALREHFTKEGWKEQEGVKLEKTTGDIDFEKDMYRVSLSYFDIGLGDVDIRISASNNVILEPGEAKDKPAAEEKPVVDAPKKGKKKAVPAIPGLPPGIELPPGVEIPPEVGDLIKKALEEGAKPKP